MRRMIPQKQIEGLENLNKFIDTLDGKSALFTLSTDNSDYWDEDQYDSTTGVYSDYLRFESQELYDLGWHGEEEGDVPVITAQGTISIPPEYGETFEDFMDYISSHEAVIELEYIDESFVIDPDDNSFIPTLNDLYWVGGPSNAYNVTYKPSSVEIKANITKSNEIQADHIQADNMDSDNISTQKLMASSEVRTNTIKVFQRNSNQPGTLNINDLTLTETKKPLKIKVGNEVVNSYMYFATMGNLFFSDAIHYPGQVIQFKLRALTSANSPVPVIAWTSDDAHISVSSSLTADSRNDTLTITVDFTNSSAFYSKIILLIGSKNQFLPIDWA